MPASKPSDRAMIARIAAATRWARTPDRAAATAPARAAQLARFEHEVDPEGLLPPDERAYRAQQLLSAHMTRMSLRAAQARRRKAGAA